jgi:hypothetical protein
MAFINEASGLLDYYCTQGINIPWIARSSATLTLRCSISLEVGRGTSIEIGCLKTASFRAAPQPAERVYDVSNLQPRAKTTMTLCVAI